MLVFALLIGTSWAGRASVARVDVDPALHAGEVALIQVAAGTAWTVAADLTSAGATDVTAYDSLDIVSARVREGESFAAALEARRAFPEVAVKMAEVGESTGALQDMLNTVADFYDEEISTNMERFVTLVEPVLLVVMGLVIAGLLLALYMPLFQLSSVLS